MRALATLLALALLAAPALAQGSPQARPGAAAAGTAASLKGQSTRNKNARTSTKAEEPKKARPAPPTADSAQGPLSELSEALGALTHLSQLCAPDLAPNPWRIRMEALLEAEGEASGARERMSGAFNRGMTEFSTTHARCTPAAKAAEEAMRAEAGRLARRIHQLFGS